MATHKFSVVSGFDFISGAVLDIKPRMETFQLRVVAAVEVTTILSVCLIAHSLFSHFRVPTIQRLYEPHNREKWYL